MLWWVQGQQQEKWVSFCKSVYGGCRASFRRGGSVFLNVLRWVQGQLYSKRGGSAFVLMVAAGPAIGEVGQLLYKS